MNLAPHAIAELRWGALTLTPGLRVDLFLLEGDRSTPKDGVNPPIGYRRFQWAIDPRLAIAVRAHRRVTLTAATGIFHQAPDPADLSAVFGNPALTPARAIHVTAGAAVRLTETLTAELVGFYKYLDGL